MKKINFSILATLFFILVACEQKNIVVEKPQIESEAVYEQTEFNRDMRDFAMAVNEAINSNKTFFGLIRDEVNKKFDGDYNVLLSQIVDAKVTKYTTGTDGRAFASGEITVRDLLNSSLDKAMGKAYPKGNKGVSERFKTAGTTLIDKLTAQYPELQIAVPFHPEHLENDSYIPPVVFLPEEYDEKTTETLPAFKNNISFSIPAKITPDSACIVISQNERGGINIDKRTAIPPVNQVKGVIDGMSIKLHWNIPPIDIVSIAFEGGYNIYRKVNNGNFNLIYTNGSIFNTSFIDNNIELNSTYYYYVVFYLSKNVSMPTHCNGGEGLTVTERPAYAQKFEVNPTGVNRARVRWHFDNKENIGTVSVYRRNEGNNFTTPFFTGRLPVTGDECIDNNVPAGARLEYKIERTVNGNTSAPVYDLMYMPYRDVTKSSSVYIKRLKFSNVKAIESWRGKPEYLIKVYRAKRVGEELTGVVANTIQIDCNSNTNDWIEINKLLMSGWRPGFDGAEWYDVLSLHIVERDGKELFNPNFDETVVNSAQALKKLYEEIKGDDNKKDNKQYSAPQRAFPWAEVIMTAVEVGVNIPQWITSADDKIGYVYLNYFDDPHSEFSISAEDADGNFSIQFSDKP